MKRLTATFTLLAAALLAATVIAAPVIGAQGDITLVSRHSDGTQGDEGSFQSDISANGRYIAFHSNATNLVDDDTNGFGDIFWRDLQTGETKRVSVRSNGTQSNNGSSEPAISPDGRFVAFESFASNLVAGDTNGVRDIFVHSVNSGQTTRVSIHSDGTQGNFDSVGAPALSTGGRFVAFFSDAMNLVDADTNGTYDVFVHDRQSGTTERVSVHTDGDQSNHGSYLPDISADGRYVTFESEASNLVDDDNNGYDDVFVHDRQTGETSRVSLDSNGVEGNEDSHSADISASGRYVVFVSGATNLIGTANLFNDVFVHDRLTGTTTRVSVESSGAESNHHSFEPAISPNGRFVAFSSEATNLAPGINNSSLDVFVHDRNLGTTNRISTHSDGSDGDDDSDSPAIANGYAVFDSNASTLVDNDVNGFTADVFVHQFAPDTPPSTTSTTTTTTTVPPGSPVSPPPPPPSPGGDYFTDDNGHLFEGDINSIAADGITRGCNPPTNDQYCPDRTLTRAEAAAFVARALDLAPAANDWFTDDHGITLEGDINRLAEAGITRGCNPPDNTMFCPDRTLTRAEAAAFIARALNLPTAINDWFTDDKGLTLESEINRLAEAGITRGCNPPTSDIYCPHDYLTRGEGAAFLNRAPLP